MPTLSKAPRRALLTKTMGGGIALRSNIAGISGGGLPLTFLYVVPIEAPCYAVRLGFGNCFNSPMAIQSASVWPSDSYSRCLDMQAVNGAENTTGLGPTGGAPASRITFDNAGRDIPALTEAGSQRYFDMPAIGTNRRNAPQGFTIQWSDFSPCTSVPTVADGLRHLLFIYVTVASGAISSDICRLRVANLDPIALRQRFTYRAVAWAGGIDWSDNPQAVGWKDAGNSFGPLFCLQYLTANPGIQVVLSGDSLATSPTNDQYSTPLHRAAWDMSSAALPIEVANLAWGGTGWSVYGTLLRDNIAALNPSIVAFQPLSRNDGPGSAKLHLLLARSLLMAEQIKGLCGATALYNSAGCEPSWNGNDNATAAFADLRLRLHALSNVSGAPLIDGPAVLGDPVAPWNYLPGLSDDNTHPNFAGVEKVVPLAHAALSKLINGAS
jgi:hypothetical protein